MSEASLEIWHLLLLSMSSINAGYYDVGVEWLELAQAKWKPNDGLKNVTRLQNLTKRMDEAKLIHDHILDHR